MNNVICYELWRLLSLTLAVFVSGIGMGLIIFGNNVKSRSLGLSICFIGLVGTIVLATISIR